MRAKEFITEDNLDEALPKWAKGALGAAALAGAGAGYMGMNKTVEPKKYEVTAEIAHPDLSVLAQTIWGEARQEGTKGMIAVGNVIKNRAEANKKMFGQGIKGVALKPKQFSCWNEGDPNREKLKDILQYDKLVSMRKSPTGEPFNEWFQKFKNTGEYLEYKSYIKAKEIAKQVLDGTVSDPTKGAVYYHTLDVKPIWRTKLDQVAQYGNHVFYTLPEKISEYKADNDMNGKGLGTTGYNANVDYRGLRVLMKPSVFLSLAAHLPSPTSVDYIVQHMEQGGALGSPFLIVDIPEQYFDGDFTGLNYAKVVGHEGRNRMLAIQKLEGDEPCEVHIFGYGELRARHFTPEIIEQLQLAMRNQDGKLTFAKGLSELFQPIG
jgi:spore germination cell wall hydrolase CwlJ-like protein